MKKLFFLFALVLFALSVPFLAGADDNKCGSDAYWSLSRSGVLTITGTGKVDRAPWDKDAVKTAVVEEGITSVSFSSCPNLTSVSLPSTITVIPDRAFYYCTSLVNIAIPDKVTVIESNAFYFCSSLEEVLFPKNLQEIGVWAFANCTSLTRVMLQDGVTAIGDSAFAYCSSLKSIRLSKKLNSIGRSAFNSCQNVTAILLPDGLTSIDQYAFSQFKAARYAALGSSAARALSRIGLSFRTPFSRTELRYLFSEDGQETGLAVTACDKEAEDFAIPDGVTDIASRAFENCKNLKAITVPASVKHVANDAFVYLNLRLVFLGDAPVFDENAFNRASLLITYPAGAGGWIEASAGTFKADLVHWTARTASDKGDWDRDPTENQVPAQTNNEGAHEYDSVWDGGTVDSALERLADGTWLRVEHKGNNVFIEQYSSSLQLLWKKTLAMELPMWGGYYHGADHHYLVFGQKNTEENNEKEIMRVVRYTANWHRLDSVSICGANTIDPFSFGSLRMVESGNYLFIHTCHRMYTAADGLNHQSNMSYKIYLPDMELIRNDENTVNQNDYVSHSFNQFVVVDGDDLVKLDHGDAYPRGLILQRQAGAVTQPYTTWGSYIHLLNFAQPEGKQYQNTGATAGGLEVSDACYLVTGKSIDQSTGLGNRYNIFIIALDKKTMTEEAVDFRWITEYTEKRPYVSNPYLVRISGTRFLLLWTESNSSDSGPYTLKYLFLDQYGRSASGIYSAQASLSDCTPVVSGHKVVWYVSKKNLTFYEIDITNPSFVATAVYGAEGAILEESAHDLVCLNEGSAATCTQDGAGACWQCTLCGKLFSDAEGRNEIAAPVTIPAAGHTGIWKRVSSSEDRWLVIDRYEMTCSVCGRKVTKNVMISNAELLGDVNGDGVVDGRDAVRLMKYLSGEEEDAEIDEANADVAVDGQIDEKDLLRLMQFFTGDELIPGDGAPE